MPAEVVCRLSRVVAQLMRDRRNSARAATSSAPARRSSATSPSSQLERHPFGLAGAARGVLHQRQVDGPGSRKRTTGRAHQGFGDDHIAQALDVRTQQTAEGDGLGHGDEQRGSGVGEDAGVATQVIGQLGRPGRRVRCFVMGEEMVTSDDRNCELYMGWLDPGQPNWVGTAGLPQGIFGTRMILLPERRELPELRVVPAAGEHPHG